MKKQPVNKPAPEPPKRGEMWEHEVYGRVKIIRPWNAKESVAEHHGGRRQILMNCLMMKIADAPKAPGTV